MEIDTKIDMNIKMDMDEDMEIYGRGHGKMDKDMKTWMWT
jgi:hypothetical protein